MKTITHKKSGRKFAELTGKDHGRVRISLGTASSREAAKLVKAANLREIELAAKAGQLGQEAITRLRHGKRITLRQGMEKWHAASPLRGEAESTATRNLDSVRQWLDFHKDLGLEKKSPLHIEPGHIYDWVNRPGGGSKSTRDRGLHALRNLFRFLVDAGFTTSNPARMVKVDVRALTHTQREQRERQPFTPAEIKTLLASLDPDIEVHRFFSVAARISLATSMRLGDVICLEWETLTRPNHIVVWTDKRDRRVCLPVNERVTPGLAAALAEIQPNDTIYLFPEFKRRYDDVKNGRPWFSVTFGRLLQYAGIDAAGKSFHSLRHTALTRWDAQGFSLEQCADFAGHTSTKTTQGYIHRKT